MRFANDQSTPAPPLPRKLEAWPGEALVTPNKAKVLSAFHSRQCASAGSAVKAAAAAAAAADIRGESQQRR